MQPASSLRGAPQWVRGLVSEEFFDACAAHPGERKNDKNHFCVDCAATLCRHCLPHDPAHDVLQIWKYASCFVVRVDGLKLFDCAGIQSHMVSDHEVVFLNERTAAEAAGGPGEPLRRLRAAATFRPRLLLPLLQGKPCVLSFTRSTRSASADPVKHLGESEQGLRCAIRVRRRQATAADAAAVTGSPSGSFRTRSRKQTEPARAPSI
ncbi:hypothetical protein PR202_gb09280 [Eleusine coracana subsp. coracana]|uniref:B box-type domain-containing protein n=1 Tax=Eleusine coracana subsp. coracana TaxID=191504 RepID=A0AAV5EG19_ELECO|nr:hypothetical protein PR202_gb09280 [Eleusine coracana subsp. coracana]